MQKVRVVCVDDEPSSLQTLHVMLAERPDIDIVAECSNPLEAIQVINKRKPDVLFLDIHMPTMTGFELLQHLDSNEMPIVIFVTAYDRYAVEAFETNALDYILKPYDHERIEKAIDHAKEMLTLVSQRHQQDRILELIEHVQKNSQGAQRFFVRKKDRVMPIKPEEIDWIEAAGDYVNFHVKGETYTLHEKISVLDEKLRGKNFVRIHRSFIVNVNRIKELEPMFQRDFTIVLHDGARLKLGRSYAEDFFKLLKVS